MALQLHINVSFNRPPDRTWRRPPGRPRNKWLDQLYETIPPVRLETSGGMLSTVDMVVQRRDGPRQLYATMMMMMKMLTPLFNLHFSERCPLFPPKDLLL